MQIHSLLSRRRLLVAGAGLVAGQALAADAVADILQAGADVPGLRALLAARRGELIAERYYGGATATQLQPINSATKSVCSMLVGLALQDRSLKSLDQTVAQLLPEAVADGPDSPVPTLSLRQILSGRSGLAFDPMRFGQLAAARPLPRFVLSQPMLPAGPSGWTYNDALVALIAPILRRAQGADLATLAQRQLFGPLRIDAFEWRRGGDGKPLASAGLALRPRDLLKLASLMAAGGQWQGQQLLPPDWVSESQTPLGPATWRAAPVDEIGYGLLWFTGRLHGQRVAWAWGYGGQFALLAPELGLAVATAATSPPPSALREQTDAVMTLVGRLVQAAT
jgi:CubicO group peptidase (beta-lactamase class C family)